MAALEEAVFVIILYLTNLYSAEVVGEIFEAHPEGSITCVISETNLCFEFRRPAITAVTPIAAPFEITPRISQLDKYNFLSSLIDDKLSSWSGLSWPSRLQISERMFADLGPSVLWFT